MHNIVLHISIYLFPRLHVLCDLQSYQQCQKTCDFGHIHNLCFWDTNYDGLSKMCVLCSYAHNASMKMTMCVIAVNITFTPT